MGGGECGIILSVSNLVPEGEEQFISKRSIL